MPANSRWDLIRRLRVKTRKTLCSRKNYTMAATAFTSSNATGKFKTWIQFTVYKIR